MIELGKFYSINRGDLYIFVTENDEMLDVGVFPRELNLFVGESYWRLTSRIAICQIPDEEAAKGATAILRAQGYLYTDCREDALEKYFLQGKESILKEASLNYLSN